MSTARRMTEGKLSFPADIRCLVCSEACPLVQERILINVVVHHAKSGKPRGFRSSQTGKHGAATKRSRHQRIEAGAAIEPPGCLTEKALGILGEAKGTCACFNFRPVAGFIAAPLRQKGRHTHIVSGRSHSRSRARGRTGRHGPRLPVDQFAQREFPRPFFCAGSSH